MIKTFKVVSSHKYDFAFAKPKNVKYFIKRFSRFVLVRGTFGSRLIELVFNTTNHSVHELNNYAVKIHGCNVQCTYIDPVIRNNDGIDQHTNRQTYVYRIAAVSNDDTLVIKIEHRISSIYRLLL